MNQGAIPRYNQMGYPDGPKQPTNPKQDVLASNPNVTPIHIQRSGPPIIESGTPPTSSIQGRHSARPVPLGRSSQMTPVQHLNFLNEQTWLKIGSISEQMGDYQKAIKAYENAPKHNPYSLPALQKMALLYRQLEEYEKAIETYLRIINIDATDGETWGALGHCYLMMNELQKAYHAYQQALCHLSDPKEPKLWYGIGILYDCYNSYENAEEAFTAVLKMDPNFEKATEIYFRLGIIYKFQHRYKESLYNFRYTLHNPPKPLTEGDIWFQIGNVHELQKDYASAHSAYERVLSDDPNHPKALLQLGILYMKSETEFYNPEAASKYLTKAAEIEKTDPFAWYVLGRCGMLLKQYNNAYDAYQQAVYCDAGNPIYWCSIGVLYYQINQYRDALDAYSRSIKLYPFSGEVWFNLGTLYESCNNQIQDAIDAYQRASEIDPKNRFIVERLVILKQVQDNRQPAASTAPPQPIDPSISDLQNQVNSSNSDPDGQVRVPGNLGHPPTSGNANPIYPPGSEHGRAHGDETNDQFIRNRKDSMRGPPQRNSEGVYTHYSNQPHQNEQEKRMGQGYTGPIRQSPIPMTRNMDPMQNSEGPYSRHNYPRESSIPGGNARSYGYNPNAPYNQPPGYSSQNRVPEQLPLSNSGPMNLNRHSQGNVQVPKQHSMYSPGNSYPTPRRGSIVRRNSPISISGEGGYPPDIGTPGSHNKQYKSQHRVVHSGVYTNPDQYPPNEHYGSNGPAMATYKSPVSDRYSLNGNMNTAVDKPNQINDPYRYGNPNSRSSNPRSGVYGSEIMDNGNPNIGYGRDSIKNPDAYNERGSNLTPGNGPISRGSRSNTINSVGTPYDNKQNYPSSINNVVNPTNSGIENTVNGTKSGYHPSITPLNSHQNKTYPPQTSEGYRGSSQYQNQEQPISTRSQLTNYDDGYNLQSPARPSANRNHPRSQSPVYGQGDSITVPQGQPSVEPHAYSNSQKNDEVYRGKIRQWEKPNGSREMDIQSHSSNAGERSLLGRAGSHEPKHLHSPSDPYHARNGSIQDVNTQQRLQSKSPQSVSKQNMRHYRNPSLTDTQNEGSPSYGKRSSHRSVSPLAGINVQSESTKISDSQDLGSTRSPREKQQHFLPPPQQTQNHYNISESKNSDKWSEKDGGSLRNQYGEPRGTPSLSNTRTPQQYKSSSFQPLPQSLQNSTSIKSTPSYSSNEEFDTKNPKSTPLSAAPKAAPIHLPVGQQKSASHTMNSNFGISGYSSPRIESPIENSDSEGNYDRSKPSPNVRYKKAQGDFLEKGGYNQHKEDGSDIESPKKLIPSKRHISSPDSKYEPLPDVSGDAESHRNPNSDSGSIKSDSNKPLYKRLCQDDNSPSQKNNQQQKRMQTDSEISEERQPRYKNHSDDETAYQQSIDQKDKFFKDPTPSTSPRYEKDKAQNSQNEPSQALGFSQGEKSSRGFPSNLMNSKSQKSPLLKSKNDKRYSDSHSKDKNKNVESKTGVEPGEEPEEGEVFDDEEITSKPSKEQTHSIKYGDSIENFRVMKTGNKSPRSASFSGLDKEQIPGGGQKTPSTEKLQDSPDSIGSYSRDSEN
ncbi:hypothetical protein BB559_003094 [Furculomyces boomerangus]|uniref:Uncharacterized protein n=1 Tax=Furculomyces boomerangus TaxID=61424 RepID=A0A2T9YP71_9FUNG|nr:hypothetical protein BB559_003094 [Furculomyces boomerangus]